MPPYPLPCIICIPAHFSDTDSIMCSGGLTWWNVECYLENMKNGVQTLSQLVKDMKSMCTFKTLQSCAQVSGSFADILPA
jgi:hypothetical protein